MLLSHTQKTLPFSHQCHIVLYSITRPTCNIQSFSSVEKEDKRPLEAVFRIPSIVWRVYTSVWPRPPRCAIAM